MYLMGMVKLAGDWEIDVVKNSTSSYCGYLFPFSLRVNDAGHWRLDWYEKGRNHQRASSGIWDSFSHQRKDDEEFVRHRKAKPWEVVHP